MHKRARFSWIKTTDGSSYDVAVTTMRHVHTIHSGTTLGIDAPVHGFVLDGRFYLDPVGVLCEPAAGSTLTQTSSSIAFSTEYAGLMRTTGALARVAASNCIVSGNVVLGVAPTAAASLSAFLLLEASTRRREGLPGRERLLAPARGHARIMPGPPVSGGGDVRALERTEAPRELAKTSISQSAGTRTVLVVRIVWSDQGPADVSMDDATYLAYAASFVSYANNRSYGNMVIEPTYTSGCVYVIPGHTYAQVGGAPVTW